MVDRTSYLKRLAAEFYPSLRREGFRGSGSTLRRQIGPIVHVVNFQGSSSGGRRYVNLGAHLDFLPDPTGATVNPKTILEYHCEFRSRVEPPAGLLGWPYGATEAGMAVSIQSLRDAFQDQGVAFFTSLGTYPDSFLTVTPDDFRDESRRGIAAYCGTPLPFARIALQRGDRAQARAFAEVGLETVRSSATSLIAKYWRLLADLADD